MQSFISETLDDILKTTNLFNDVVFILPSQRAKVFLKQTFKEKIDIGFLPEILNIEQFINNVSGLEKVDSIQLLFHFYSVYKKNETNPVTFEIFSSWAFTVLQDFNEIDQHLVDAKDIFLYLRDIQRLKKWSVKGNFKETELIKDHYVFIEKLNKYYTAFYQFLLENKIGYQGLIYRESCIKIDAYLEKNSQKKFFLIGFNALNKAEEFLFQKVLEKNESEIYWDIDETFFNSNHLAGRFIRKYKNEWKYFEKNKIKTLSNTFSLSKNIQVIGASKNVTQIKHAGEIINNLNNIKNTALILADESLLPITLNSLPQKINAINITMGYPLKDIPTTSLIYSIFKLFTNQEKLQKETENQFYFKDVLTFFKHQSIYSYFPSVNNFSEEIAKKNQTFINYNNVCDFLENLNTETNQVFKNLFKPFTSINNFLQRIINLIYLLKDKSEELEKEYFFRFYTIFNQLKTLQKEYKYFKNIKTLSIFFRQLVTSETLSFQGEPLKGLQLMGMLETRVLDFENIILASTNEGILPANSKQNSFIPFDVKLDFGLPTYREKDAIYSYHFFRLLQRAKNVFILYNTEHDVFGSGEKSRFVTQLEMIKKEITHKTISPKIITKKKEIKEVFKEESIFNRLSEIAEKGFSPSSITNYLYNPFAFYKQKVLKIKEFNDVEETVAANTMGTVVHEVLDDLYKPYIGKFISKETISEMEKKVASLVQKHFNIWFKNGNITTGKNRLIFEVAKRFVQNFLVQEKKLLKDENNTLKIIATEQKYTFKIDVDGINFPIILNGEVDRVDELNGVTRIIDYKTGSVTKTELKVSDFTILRQKEQFKAIQVLIYAYLYTKSTNYNFSKPITAGVYSFKNLNNGFLAIDFAPSRKPKETNISEEKLEEFLEEIKNYIKEIFNPNIAFIEPANLKY